MRCDRTQQLVVGVGNEQRRDDAAGLEVLRLLAERLPAWVRAVAHDGDGAALMELWQPYRRVLIVDAMQAGYSTGTVLCLQGLEVEVPRGVYSSHAFGLDAAVALARVLGRLPSQLTIYAIQGENFGLGEGLSAPVAAAVHEVAERILGDLGRQGDISS